MLLERSLEELAKTWASWDPNETTANIVLNTRQNADDFRERLAFGTAGLRAVMKPGPMGMNDLVVLQTAQGLAKYCWTTTSQGLSPTVVIGYDHRANPELNLSSLSFAIITALVFQFAGYNVFLLDGYVATPLVPFSMSRIPAAVVGIMVTASHNPKQDAGYKVYWKDGCQIRTPIDKEIADCISTVLKPLEDYRAILAELYKLHAHDPCLGLSDKKRTKAMTDAYFGAFSSLITGPYKNPRVKFCYSAMHGVGYPFCKRQFEAFGLPPFVSVSLQQEPDYAFPTVAFPNPEEKGALDLAKQTALENSCQVVLANDPDADRLAVAEYGSDNEWTDLTGDQIGVMLGHWLWQTSKSSTKPIAMCASVVSSGMLREIARVEGFHFEDTLTGFKWIGSRAHELNQGAYNSIFCYEEALGFCCGNVIFDKDGITAAAVFAELTLSVYENEMTLCRHLQSLHDKYGEFVSNNGYFLLKDPAIVSAIMADLTNHGKFDTLDYVGPYKVASFRYLGEPGHDSSKVDAKPSLPTSRSSPMMSVYFDNGCVAQFRASGTEPKFKYYIELKGEPGVSREKVSAKLMEMSNVILDELFSKHGLMQ